MTKGAEFQIVRGEYAGCSAKFISFGHRIEYVRGRRFGGTKHFRTVTCVVNIQGNNWRQTSVDQKNTDIK